MQFHIFLSAIIAFPLARLFMGLKVEGHANIPRTGCLIIASNHISNWDPPVLGVAVALRREVFYLAKEELFKPSKFYSLLIKKYNAIPIRRTTIDRKSIRKASFLLRKGRVIVIFPEGRRNKNPREGFLKPLPGVGYLALKSKAPIIPTYIENTAASMRALITRRTRVLVRFGKKMDTRTWAKAGGPLLKRSIDLTNRVMEEIEALSNVQDTLS
jgi:1-acyl-sn-glycerol-3-phosphate acyltransferase